ncbi:MAG: hypothetical protein AAF967_04065 [Pseudomonadota bacterium]
MINDIIVVVVAIAAAGILFSKQLQSSKTWQATVTPLASIIGSGFLVSVPLVAANVGNWATVAMTALIVGAYLIGSAIRFNIRYTEPLLAKPATDANVRLTQSLERLSHLVLAFAYFISVAYYLVLLGNFLLKGIGTPNPAVANIIATVILGSIGCLGFFKGLGTVERVEKYTVGINLTVIAALLGGLIWYNGAEIANGTWQVASSSPAITLGSVQALLGLLIAVQGFETSRFMGDEYDAQTRIKTMRYAQWISAVIYIAFFALSTSLFTYLGKDTGVTAVIGLVGHVALILPLMLTIGAVASQFSASVADSVGCAGLLEEISDRRISVRHTYPLIALVAIAITWSADVFRIITFASQAFAMFYMVQSCVALSVAYGNPAIPNRGPRMILFASVALFCLCVVLFGIPSGG